MDWERLSLSNLQLTDTEHRYYGDIYIYCCENSDSENVSMVKVAELLNSANLPRNVLLKIIELCGEKTSTLNRKQFYGVLKLVAAHQAGLEIQKDTITLLLDDAALPRFTWTSNDEDNNKTMEFGRGIQNRLENCVPESTTESESDVDSPREAGGSTDSPTPTNSVTQDRKEGAERREDILDSVSGGWQGLLVSDEQRQLLGTEEESSDRHTSDEGDGDSTQSRFPPEEVWIISDEQRDYYAAQFAQLQPDPEGLLAGSVARTFFEKSRLPVTELRRIWQMADVTRDGALSLQEFYVAMHLVVLMRNHIPLPETLPPSLTVLLKVPSVAPISAPAVNSQNSKNAKTSSPEKNAQSEKSKEWTKFVDSPTGGNGSLTSPGPKPVNFDFQKSALERDPKILHPVPLRLTPETSVLASNGGGGNSAEDELQVPNMVTLVQRPIAKKPLAVDEAIVATPKKEPPPPPPPRPYRTHTRSSSLDLNKLGKNGQQSFLGAPPLVPPRVSPGITSPRKLVNQRSEGEAHKANNENQAFVADFSQFTPKTESAESTNPESSVHPSQQFTGICGAFHIYRKPSPKHEGTDEITREEIEESQKMSLKELREKNAELRQVCEELTKELASALQERINLRAKLLLLT